MSSSGAKESIGSTRLARENREPLENHQLLQLLVQPRSAPGIPAAKRQNVIEPPEPFCFYQGLPLEHSDLDGSERAIDYIAHPWSDGQKILKEVARLGGLRRPCDGWERADCLLQAIVRQSGGSHRLGAAAGDGRLLRRFTIHDYDPVDNAFKTATGNRWRVVTQHHGEVVTEVVVVDGENRVKLPRLSRWWQRLRRR